MKFIDITIKPDMVQKNQRLKTNKSHGHDEIHPRLLKELSAE